MHTHKQKHPICCKVISPLFHLVIKTVHQVTYVAAHNWVLWQHSSQGWGNLNTPLNAHPCMRLGWRKPCLKSPSASFVLHVFLPHLIQYNIFFFSTQLVKESKANNTFRTTLKQIAPWTHPQARSTGRKKSWETDRQALQAGKQAAFTFFLSLSLLLTVHQQPLLPTLFRIPVSPSSHSH